MLIWKNEKTSKGRLNHTLLLCSDNSFLPRMNTCQHITCLQPLQLLNILHFDVHNCSSLWTIYGRTLYLDNRLRWKAHSEILLQKGSARIGLLK
ncbi:unnamed protein product [Nezara viridula]|uniref:Uncharacterized protein n=1 Tax=Nezara viridula TaxID=85310 RepID=A0A9P0HGV6_NEZVI|nr:unnamed protein product [Nezara viridula]